MDEIQIDRELASLLSLEPSPEFRARVRARIANDPLPRAWVLPWRVAMAGAVLAAIAVVMTVRVLAPRPARPPASVIEERAAVPTPDAVTPAPQVATSATAVPGRRAPGSRAPEVVVDERARRGLEQLNALVREGRTRFVFADEQILQEPIRDIVVAPIAVVPIEVATAAEGVGDSEGDEQ